MPPHKDTPKDIVLSIIEERVDSADVKGTPEGLAEHIVAMIAGFDNVREIVYQTVSRLQRDHLLDPDEVGARTIDELAVAICDKQGIPHPKLDGELWVKSR